MRWLALILFCLFFLFIQYENESNFSESAGVLPATSELETLVKEKKWQKAAEYVSRVRQTRELNTQELFHWAQIQYELGQPNEALISINQVFEKGYVNSDTRELKARCLLALQRFDEAEKWLRYWLKKEPENPDSHYWLGQCLVLRPNESDEVNVNRCQQGLSHLHQALRQKTVYKDQAHQLLADTYMFLGIHFRDTQQFSRAIDYMETASRLKPEEGSFHHTLGKLYIYLKRWPEALDSLDRAHTQGVEGTQKTTHLLDDLYEVYHELAAVALLEGDYLQAMEFAQQGLQWVTTRTARFRLLQLEQVAREKQIDIWRQQARKDSGDQLWPKILQLAPFDAEALWETYPEGGIPQKILKKILQSPWGKEARWRLAHYHWNQDRFTEGIQWLIESWLLTTGPRKLEIEEELFSKLHVVQSPPQSHEWSLVWKWQRADIHSPEWLELSDKVKKYLNERYYIWLYIADTHLKKGQLNEARRLLEEVKSLDPPKRAWSQIEGLQNQLQSREKKIGAGLQ